MQEQAMRATSQQLERVATFSSCEIADALIKLGNDTGGYLADLQQFSGHAGQTLVGEAYTVEMVDSRDKDAPKLDQHFIDTAEPGSIVVVQTPHHAKNASLGGLLATALAVKGVKGFVTSGRCRDLAELRALEFPVYARGQSILGQSPFTRPSRVQVPIPFKPVPTYPASKYDDFPATTVHPRDVVLADLDGVVVIRPDVLERVLELAERGREVDERSMKDLKAGAGVKETFRKHRGS
ncbi:RraA-like protein [Rhodotorula sp. JG-1b]|nr:RraA-like protein [Rhodotorula sp. JG-1b]